MRSLIKRATLYEQQRTPGSDSNWTGFSFPLIQTGARGGSTDSLYIAAWAGPITNSVIPAHHLVCRSESTNPAPMRAAEGEISGYGPMQLCLEPRLTPPSHRISISLPMATILLTRTSRLLRLTSTLKLHVIACELCELIEFLSGVILTNQCSLKPNGAARLLTSLLPSQLTSHKNWSRLTTHGCLWNDPYLHGALHGDFP